MTRTWLSHLLRSALAVAALVTVIWAGAAQAADFVDSSPDRILSRWLRGLKGGDVKQFEALWVSSGWAREACGSPNVPFQTPSGQELQQKLQAGKRLTEAACEPESLSVRSKPITSKGLDCRKAVIEHVQMDGILKCTGLRYRYSLEGFRIGQSTRIGKQAVWKTP